MRRDPFRMERPAGRPAVHGPGEPLSPPHGAVPRRYDAGYRLRTPSGRRHDDVAVGDRQSRSLAAGGAARTLSRIRRLSARALPDLMKTTTRLFFVIAMIGCSQGSQPSIAQQTQTSTSASVSEGRRTAITSAVAAVAPAVVTVQTTMVQQINPDIFAQMFGARPTTRVMPG